MLRASPSPCAQETAIGSARGKGLPEAWNSPGVAPGEVCAGRFSSAGMRIARRRTSPLQPPSSRIPLATFRLLAYTARSSHQCTSSLTQAPAWPARSVALPHQHPRFISPQKRSFARVAPQPAPLTPPDMPVFVSEIWGIAPNSKDHARRPCRPGQRPQGPELLGLSATCRLHPKTHA